MSCTAHRDGMETRSRVVCFECYRSRVDRPERVSVVATPFPRVLTNGELLHRRRMLTHLTRRVETADRAAARPFFREPR
jgi:hypothetical protein